MHVIVMWAGGILVAMGALFFSLIIVMAGRSGGPGVLLPAVGVGGGLLLSGAILYCFGAIVQELRAIRRVQEQQLEIFDKLGRPKS